MSEPQPPAVAKSPVQRLAIVHFLGWMIGVGAVLAIYRAATELTEPTREVDLSQRLIQLGFGLAYGTAVSGLGLFLWRWWRGKGSGPTQPGHWLLVFGGIGLIVDVGVAAIVYAVMMSRSGNDYGSMAFRSWSNHQIIGWSIAALIASVVLFRLRAAWWWRVVVVVVLVLTIANVAANIVYVLGANGVFAGTWPYDISQFVRVVGALACIAVIGFAEACDRRQALARDWLHSAGLLMALSLASVDLAVQSYFLWLRWR
jgi:hypothetical protein